QRVEGLCREAGGIEGWGRRMAPRTQVPLRDLLVGGPRHREHQVDAVRAEPDDDDPRRRHGDAGAVVLLVALDDAPEVGVVAGRLVEGVPDGRLRTFFGVGGLIVNELPERCNVPKRGLTVIFAFLMNRPSTGASGSSDWTAASTSGRAFSGVRSSASITW